MRLLLVLFAILGTTTLLSCENFQKANTIVVDAIDTFKDVNWAEDVVPQFTSSHHENYNKNIEGLLDVRIPDSIPSQEKKYSEFKLSYNKDNHTANWVAWQLSKHDNDGKTQRSNKFWQDEDVEGCASPSDYKNSGYDKGHMSPAADNKLSEISMHECFAMTNMCPQNPELNQRAWSTLEKKCRAWADRDSVIYIVAGPIYRKSDIQRIGATGVRVPSAFYKVIIAPYLPSPRGIGFIYPNMGARGNMQNYSVTIDEVERITGYDFFYALPDSLENIIESTASFKEWNLMQ